VSWLPPRPDRAPIAIARTAQFAIDAVLKTMAERHDDLMEVTNADLWENVGSIGDDFRDRARVCLVLHLIDEVVHHGSEVALLRDLYRSSEEKRGGCRPPTGLPSRCPGVVSGCSPS
jgi:hypothetical protein